MLISFWIKHSFNAGHFTLKVPQNVIILQKCHFVHGLWFLHLVVAKALQKATNVHSGSKEWYSGPHFVWFEAVSCLINWTYNTLSSQILKQPFQNTFYWKAFMEVKHFCRILFELFLEIFLFWGQCLAVWKMSIRRAGSYKTETILIFRTSRWISLQTPSTEGVSTWLMYDD